MEFLHCIIFDLKNREKFPEQHILTPDFNERSLKLNEKEEIGQKCKSKIGVRCEH